MLHDLLQSKNAPAALIVIVAGALLAVALPALTDFPGWAAGAIGLSIGTVAGLIVLQGRGANRDELLGLRTAIKAAQRGERAPRSAALSAELAELFAAIDDVAGEVETRQQRLREAELERDRARGELEQQQEQTARGRDDVARALDGLGELVSEQSSCADQLDASARQARQLWHAAADDLEQLAGRVDASASALTSLAAESQDGSADAAALLSGAREALAAIDALPQELRALEQSGRSLQGMLESAAFAPREPDPGQRASQQLVLEWERCLDGVVRAQGELGRLDTPAGEPLAMIAAMRTPIGTLGLSLEAVEDLAEQMSLLALNAAIVAAQAGDQGRGFGVIADGMKDLADRAQLATKQLSAVLTALTDHTQLAQQGGERHAQALSRYTAATEECVQALRRGLEATQRAAIASTPPPRDGEPLERVLAATRQLTQAISDRAREIVLLSGPADQLLRGAQQLERRQHEQVARVRQLAATGDAVARALEQLGKAQRGHARALEDTPPGVERLRELQREHERRLSSLLEGDKS